MERQFEGVWIPAGIWLRDDISPSEKFLLCEINSLDTGDGCYASDSYLARHAGLTVRRMVQMLTNLRRLKLVQTLSFDGRKRFLRAFHWQPNGVRNILRSSSAINYGAAQQYIADRNTKLKSSFFSKEKNEGRSSASRPGKVPSFKLVFSKDTIPNTPLGHLCKDYANWMTAKRLHPTFIKHAKTYQVEPKWKNWLAAGEILLKSHVLEDVEEVMDWYFDNFRSPYLRTHCSFAKFCEGFESIKKAMYRDLKREADPEDEYERRPRKKIVVGPDDDDDEPVRRAGK